MTMINQVWSHTFYIYPYVPVYFGQLIFIHVLSGLIGWLIAVCNTVHNRERKFEHDTWLRTPCPVYKHFTWCLFNLKAVIVPWKKFTVYLDVSLVDER